MRHLNENQIFQYNGSPITFQKGDSVMVNATEMAEYFGKRPVDWLKYNQSQEFLSELSKVRNITLADLVQVTKGGNNPGTWMHEDVAMEFARWLSPAFAIWCNDRIKELLRTGVTTISNDDEAIAYAMQVLNRRLEQAKAEKQQLEESNAKLQPKAAFADAASRKICFLFGYIESIRIFVALTDGNCIYLAGQAVNLLILYMGIFYARTLGYWRLSIRRYLDALRGMLSSVSSVYGNRYFVAYNISLNAYRYE